VKGKIYEGERSSLWCSTLGLEHGEFNCNCSSTKKERSEAILEGDAEVVAWSEVTSDGHGGVGTQMGSVFVQDDEEDGVHLVESIWNGVWVSLNVTWRER
jgi:predicted RNA-binding protein with TRAM domain